MTKTDGDLHPEAQELFDGAYWSYYGHEDYPVSDWITECQNGDTRRGYHAWLSSKLYDRDAA